MVQRIPLANGRGFAQVSDAKAELAGRYSWSLKTNRYGGRYACAYVPGSADSQGRGQKKIYLHQLVTGWRYVDHEDGDGLNCCDDNLRKATHAQNMANMKANRGSSSRFKGVGWSAAAGKWRARIRHRHLGVFADEEEAARVYDAAALAEWGEFARLNFPSPLGSPRSGRGSGAHTTSRTLRRGLPGRAPRTE